MKQSRLFREGLKRLTLYSLTQSTLPVVGTGMVSDNSYVTPIAFRGGRSYVRGGTKNCIHMGGTPVQEVELQTERDRELALSSAHHLKEFLEGEGGAAEGEPLLLRTTSAEGRHKTIPVPGALLDVLLEALEGLGSGRELLVDALDRDLSTQQAADILQVSRPYLVDNLLREDELPYHKVGNRYRIPLAAVLRYKANRREGRKETLRKLASESQEIGVGYD